MTISKISRKIWKVTTTSKSTIPPSRTIRIFHKNYKCCKDWKNIILSKWPKSTSWKHRKWKFYVSSINYNMISQYIKSKISSFLSQTFNKNICNLLLKVSTKNNSKKCTPSDLLLYCSLYSTNIILLLTSYLRKIARIISSASRIWPHFPDPLFISDSTIFAATILLFSWSIYCLFRSTSSHLW